MKQSLEKVDFELELKKIKSDTPHLNVQRCFKIDRLGEQYKSDVNYSYKL
jgi:hypothetical protein